MDRSSESPSKQVKVTYLNRHKRKRTLSGDADAQSNPESDVSEEAVKTSPKRSPKKVKKMSDMRPPESTIPRRAELSNSSESSTKRASRESEVADTASVASVRSKAKKHVRGSSSVTSLKEALQQDGPSTSTPPYTKKPPSVVKARTHKPNSSASHINPAPSESDGASVADSVMSTTRVRRTEPERIEYFKNQPECGSLEPHRAKCLRCHKYVNLGTKQTYTVRPWEFHRARCDNKPACTPPAPESPGAEESQNEKATSSSTPRRTEEERKAILLADPRAQEVQPDQALCKKCQKWIRLGTTNYALTNWKQHQGSCSAAVPSSRVATAERKLKLVNDPQAKSFGLHHVICGTCDTKVTLEGEGDYCLTSWEAHKADCSESRSPRSKLSEESGSNSVPFPMESTRPPASIGSTSTVVAEAGTQLKGVKRRLEETEDSESSLEDPDARPHNRPRTETYVVPEKEPPSVLGWFLMPFKSFVRGFKESISNDA